MIIPYNEWREINEGKIADFFKGLVKKKSAFTDDIKTWFDIFRANHKQWEYTNLNKIISKAPTKESLDELERFLRTELKKLGAKELLDFIKNIKQGDYKKDFDDIEGENGLIEELFNLIRQAIEF